MRKIRIIEHISLDGVIQAPGGPEEDPNGFKYGGWAGPHADPEAGGGHRRGSRRGFRFAAGPASLRYLERLLAERPLRVRWRTVLTRRRNMSRPAGRRVWHGGRPRTLGRTSSRAFAVFKEKSGPHLIVWGQLDADPGAARTRTCG
jgi:hypothetical protein